MQMPNYEPILEMEILSSDSKGRIVLSKGVPDFPKGYSQKGRMTADTANGKPAIIIYGELLAQTYSDTLKELEPRKPFFEKVATTRKYHSRSLDFELDERNRLDVPARFLDYIHAQPTDLICAFRISHGIVLQNGYSISIDDALDIGLSNIERKIA